MSEETKEQLQRQIDEEMSTITACNARAADLRKALSLIKDKPRHGDYGDRTYEEFVLLESRGYRIDSGMHIQASSLRTFSNPFESHQGNSVIRGNIFDDLKAAGPDGILLPLTREEAESLLRNGRYKGYQNVDAKIKAKLKQHHEQVD